MKIEVKESDFTPGSPEHVAYLQTVLAETSARADAAAAAVKAAEDKANAEIKAAKDRADAAERHAKELPARIAKRRKFCEDIGLIRTAILAKGLRCDAPPPSEEADAGDESNVIANVLGMLMPDFEAKGKDPLFLEGALMMLVHQLKGGEPDGDEQGELDGANAPEQAPPNQPPAAMPARSDSRHVDAYSANLTNTEALWKQPLTGTVRSN